MVNPAGITNLQHPFYSINSDPSALAVSGAGGAHPTTSGYITAPSNYQSILSQNQALLQFFSQYDSQLRAKRMRFEQLMMDRTNELEVLQAELTNKKLEYV